MALDGAAIRSMSSLRASLSSRHVSAWLECDKARSSQVVWCSISGPQCIPWYPNISKPTDIYWDLLYLYNYIYIYLFISIDLHLGMNLISHPVVFLKNHHTIEKREMRVAAVVADRWGALSLVVFIAFYGWCTAFTTLAGTALSSAVKELGNVGTGWHQPPQMDPNGRFDWIYRFTTLLIQRHQFFSGLPGAIVACLVAVLIYPTNKGHDFDPWLSVARLRTAQGGHRFWCSASVNLWRGQWLKIIDPTF